MNRLSYEKSCQKLGYTTPPPLPEKPPTPYDDIRGVEFFRTEVKGDYSNLTLPRCFFNKSEISDASFENTDLSESFMCWNDFINVNFNNTDLSGSDLRASLFENCDFKGAKMTGAIATKGADLDLSEEQTSVINWVSHEDEPDGG